MWIDKPELKAIVERDAGEGEDYILSAIEDALGEVSGEEQVSVWRDLPQPYKSYYALYTLDGEVFNAGFGNFFRRYATVTS